MRATLAVLLIVSLAHVAVVAGTALPPVHYFYDASVMRDTATVWASLSWNPRDERHFWPVAVLSQHEGPLQWTLMNAYACLVGTVAPLTPRTMQLPNIVLAWAAALLAWRLVARLVSEDAGRLAAVALAVMPWLAMTARRPWIFNLLSVVTQLLVLHAYVRLAEQPERRRYRVLAPLTLALYLLTGVDWPSFLAALVLLLVLTGGWRAALRERANVAWLAVLGVYAAWAAALFWYGRVHDSRLAQAYTRSLVVYPFFKVLTLPLHLEEPMSVARVVDYAWRTFGLVLPLGLGGIVVAGAGRSLTLRPVATPDGVRRGALTALAAWMVLGLGPLLRTPNSVTFGYVVAVPMAVLAAVFMAWMGKRLGHGARAAAALAALVALMLALQLRITRDRNDIMWGNDDRRVPAAAVFLNERRPDLLEPGRTALLPRDDAANVGQYARGRNARLVMPPNFPADLRLYSAASKLDALLGFVSAYRERGEIRADWLLLSSEILAREGEAGDFYRRLRADRRVHWIAELRDRRGRALFLGEVRGEGGNEPPVVAVEPLADTYTREYEHIGFLRRNVRAIFHE
jgi:hypothetical protein